ncbi:MAG: ATP-dependent Clp protease ATP-binding subunit [Oscillospiraceae bacterium]
MQPTLCSRCQKNPAVIFITKMDGNDTKSEGLCLKCAKELHIKPVEDMMQKMGISDEDLDGITNEMMSAFGGAEGLEGLMAQPGDEDADDDDDDGRTATFPFLSKLFGSGMNPPASSPDQTPTPGRTERSSRDEAPGGKGERAPKRKFLENYCISLTQKAADGKLDRVIGRDAELSRAIQILNRRQKNNPCLIGEPGVGKTAIAEGLALRIFNHDVPYKLLDKEVYLLDLTALVAGTQFRGQFESRMKGLIEEIRKLGNIILVIDEVHNIVGAGDAEGSMNAANILKPALSRGEIQVIGATTLTEYRKYIEKDAALERRFQPITVEEPSIEDAVEIIKGIAPYYEEFHHVTISPEISRLAVTMSERYITDRFLPDKAIDLIDEACSDVNLHNKALARTMAIDKELADLEKEREVILAAENRMKQSENLTAEQNAETEKTYQRIAELKSIELRLTGEKDALSAEAAPPLTAAHLARVIELWTKIPASQIQAQEFERLAQLETRLKAHIVGQDDAVASVAAAIRRGRVGISPKRKPVSFIFVGATGVGKTELVKQLSADLFDTPDSLIRIDMSEYMEKHTVSRLIGSPPGYVGYDDAGQLTEKIRRKPYSVVLFDEIEKAHPDVMNILLQILDDGRITDAHGKVVNFENTVIVMTSNAGSDLKSGSLGFNRSPNEQGREKAVKALENFLRPEFINRVDEIVYFNQLTEENFKAIAKIMMGELITVMAGKGIHLTYGDDLLDYLVSKSYSTTYGARNLRRLIQKDLEDPIATRLIDGYTSPVTQMKISVADGKVEVLAL